MFVGTLWHGRCYNYGNKKMKNHSKVCEWLRSNRNVIKQKSTNIEAKQNHTNPIQEQKIPKVELFSVIFIGFDEIDQVSVYSSSPKRVIFDYARIFELDLRTIVSFRS